MDETRQEIQDMVDRETRAWDARDVDLLMSVFHPDMVWFWPPDNTSHDPTSWESPLGRFDRERWSKIYTEMFAEYALVHNQRKTVEIKITAEGDGALAVVDVDTLWESRTTGERMHWNGRTGKTYTKVDGGWKMIAQSGVLIY
jgi:ketosteroid isomerase-like protein